MLDIKFIRENITLIKDNCNNRRSTVDIDHLLRLDEERRENIKMIESLRAERKQRSKGKPSNDQIIELRTLGEKILRFEEKQLIIENEYEKLLLQVPNLTHKDTPVGGEDDFKTVATVGKIPKFDFSPLTHDELLVKNDLLDFERGTKVAGAKFYFVKNNLVRLNQALINYGIDIVTKHGYTLIETPDLAKNEILTGIGFNPRGTETQVYSIENTDLSLIGTAEITMGGYHANEVLDFSQGAKKYVALSHCFRTEAGAYGRESKGLYRVHQFAKLEMFIYCKPDESEKYHTELLAIEQEIINGLKLPYRVIDIASGDLGGPAYRKFDIEAWMTMRAGNGKTGDYGEITSTSNCTDYQARRLNIKFRKEDGETEYVHTLNGTAVVLSRFPLAIVENYQQEDGSIAVPEILKKYCGLEKL